MDRKFTRQAEVALKLAKTTAKSCEHSYIGTEHLLTGLLKEPEGTAGKILAEFGVDQEKLMELIGQLVAPPQGETALKEPKDPAAQSQDPERSWSRPWRMRRAWNVQQEQNIFCWHY